MDGSPVIFRKLPVAETKARLRSIVSERQEKSRRRSAPPAIYNPDSVPGFRVQGSRELKSFKLVRSSTIESRCITSLEPNIHAAQNKTKSQKNSVKIFRMETLWIFKLFVKVLISVVATFILCLVCDSTYRSFTKMNLLTFEGDYKLEELSADLNDNVYGQHLAVNRIIEELQTFFLKDSKTHLLALYLLGSSGTGKTFVSTILTNHFQSLGINVNWFIFPISIDAQTMISKVTLWSTNIFVLDDFEIKEDSLTRVLALFKDSIEHLTSDRFDGTKFVFVISSNLMAEEINDVALDANLHQIFRQQLTMEHFSFLSSSNDSPDSEKTNSSPPEEKEKHVFIPFLPLTREFVRLCILKIVNSFDNQSRFDDEYVTFVANSITYFPFDYPIFSKQGCKKILLL